MPRPKREGADGRKTRSRSGCWPCKARKVKCGEEKPSCLNCQRQAESCDYAIRLNWGGRNKKKDDEKHGKHILMLDNVTSAPSLSLRSNPPADSSRHNRNPLPEAGSFGLSGTKIASPNGGSGSQFSARLFNDRPELRSPFSPVSPSVYRCRPYSSGIDKLSHPSSNEFPSGVSEAALSMATSPQLWLSQTTTAYPSPIGSAVDTRDQESVLPSSFAASKKMPPPDSLPTCKRRIGQAVSPEKAAKGIRLSSGGEANHLQESSMMHRASSYGPGIVYELPGLTFQQTTPKEANRRTTKPMTPASSSSSPSDETSRTWRPASGSQIIQDRDVRRVSVSSLLSGSPDLKRTQVTFDNPAQPDTDAAATSPTLGCGLPSRNRQDPKTHTKIYGLDRGLPDLDIPRNDDAAAINSVSPFHQKGFDAWPAHVNLGIPEFGFGLQKRELVFAEGGYYDSHVPIRIARTLEPLPSTLLENPMNLLYFHHFLNHTARILVVHDCSQNPFRTLLPQMALKDKNLLNLLLAYSASHRARLLAQPEPANRIALWVQDVFPSLRHAVDDAETLNVAASDGNLATAIMLTSLEIISPSAFGVLVPWQKHLNVARRIIRHRGTRLQPFPRGDPVPHFLHFWLAYIDVFGSLSSPTLEEPLFYPTLEEPSRDKPSTASNEDNYTIECMLGFTSHCVPILAQIANLARICSNEREDAETGAINHDWQPPPHIQRECEKLEAGLERSRAYPVRHCSGRGHCEGSTNSEDALTKSEDAIAKLESAATNEAFHHAALIHLLRRVRNLPRSAPEIRHAIQNIVGALSRVRPGGSAEACLLFPMFTAGAEAEDEHTRLLVLDRVHRLEGTGMMQVGRARTLMEKVWQTGLEWETLAQGEEFFG